MSELSVRHYTPDDADAIHDLQLRYEEVHPGAVVIAAYDFPAYEAGRNILIVTDGDGRILGYAPLYPRPVERPTADEPHVLWTVIKPDPELEGTPEGRRVQDLLYDHIVQRAREIAAEWSEGPVVVRAEYVVTEEPAIAYARSRGMQHAFDVYRMGRDLDQPIPDRPAPEGVTVEEWKMPTEAEQIQYLGARNTAFPEQPWDLAELQYFLRRVLWPSGTTFAAFDEGRVVGNVMVYVDPEVNERLHRQVGMTEDIFVLPDYCGRGIAAYLITWALRYLQEQGLDQAQLEVRVENENALELYRRLGYRTLAHNVVLEQCL